GQIHNGSVPPGTQERIDTLNSLHVGVLIQGPASEIMFSNNAALGMLGLTYDELSGATPVHKGWQVSHEDGSILSCSAFPLQNVISTNQGTPVILCVQRPVTNDKVWLKIHAEPIFNNGQCIKELICS